MNIEITRYSNVISIYPFPIYVEKYLQFSKRTFAKKNYRLVNKFEKQLLHSVTEDGIGITLQGFFHYVKKLVEKNYDVPVVTDSRDIMPPVDWSRVRGVGPRPYQIEKIVDLISVDESGIIKAVPGYGKTYFQAFVYAAYSELNTILAIPSKQIVMQTYHKFQELFPDKHIGIVGAGYKDRSDDITITTFKSLRNCALERCELFLADEIQLCTGDGFQSDIEELKPRRMFGFTATDDQLFSGADKVIKGIFGERIIEVPYDDAVEDEAVVPITVYMVRMKEEIYSIGITVQSKLKKGIRMCQQRHALIGEILKEVPVGWQTIVFVNFVKDHLKTLYPHLPDGTRFVHRESTKGKVKAIVNGEEKDFALSVKQQDRTIDDFCNNEFQFLVGTDCVRAGFDAPNCRVVMQCGGGASNIEIIQESGRVTRNKSGKDYGIIVDIYDAHDEFLQGLSDRRIEIYKSQNWDVKVVDSPKDIVWHLEQKE